jgi:RNA recognition motif-containing protein
MSSIYVGNLPYTTTEEELAELFSEHGNVHSVKLIIDHATGRPRGFGFVEMDKEHAKDAIKSVNGNELGGRTLRVNEAHQRPPSGRDQSNQENV